MNDSSSDLSAFGYPFKIIWKNLPNNTVDSVHPNLTAITHETITYHCEAKKFSLFIPNVANFIALPEDHCIIVEKKNPNLSQEILHTWLLETVLAYNLQYHGYLVLHGSAVLIQDKAVIFSGQSGAGKSTLARAFLQKNHPFITDDLVVIQRNSQDQYCILPGPKQLKLWKDAMCHFKQNIANAEPIHMKTEKYAIPAPNLCEGTMIPIKAFYELHPVVNAPAQFCETLDAVQSVKTIMQNAYRYFMLKPLGKLPNFLADCSGLAQQIGVRTLFRTQDFQDLAEMMRQIELDIRHLA